MWALLVGLAGGSILAPLHYVPCSQLGLVFLPSFGIGAMATSPLMVLLHRIWNGCLPNFQFRDTFLIGALSGECQCMPSVCIAKCVHCVLC